MQEIIRKGYIGNPAQLVTLRRVNVSEGKAKGTGIIEVRTAGGLDLDVLPDAGLDIGQCRFRGVNMSWMCKNGYDSPAAIAHFETEYNNTFPGGLLYTCGLRSAGQANRDGGEWHPVHGRYHSLLADHVCAEIVDDEIRIAGTMRESALFGHCLEVRREIRIPAFGAAVTVQDTVTNQTPRDEELMLIYHCNFGYPFLSEAARLTLPEARETVARTEFGRAILGREGRFETPVPGEEERVYFHRMESDFSAVLENPELGVRMTMTWSGDTLPLLGQWRDMASGDYVLGLEPTNCYIMGRSAERENGTLRVLRAFETMTTSVTISFA